MEVGNIFQLGTGYAESAGGHFLDEHGAEQPIWMGSYGIGSGRLLACVAEEHHDGDGLRWPMSVAPFDVHLIALGGRSEADREAMEVAERIHDQLEAAGLETLHDDRDERAGVKFADADLIGIPLRVVVARRALAEGGAEVRLRGDRKGEIVPIEKLAEVLTERKQALIEEIEARISVPPYA